MGLTNWKTLYKSESYGARNLGIEVRVAVDRELGRNDDMAMYRIADQIEDVIMRESLRLDATAQLAKKEEHDKLMELFGDEKIFAEEIPNGYSTSWYYSMSPWYKVTTSKGIITLGWRKRVIEIQYEQRVNAASADSLFPDEDVTKSGRMIHAWGYDKAKRYISLILST
jgi:hypothetical protein